MSATHTDGRALPLPLARGSVPAAAVAALRPRQWLKNILVFAGILYASHLGDPLAWTRTLVVFVAYCAASSAAYLVNDLRDRELDRAHPVKRLRPIASGALPARAAKVLAVALALAALALAAALGIASLALLLAFVGAQLLYSFRLKHVVVADVLSIAGLFTLRAAAGAVAIAVRISPWLLVCAGLLALLVALAKRQSELYLVRSGATAGRPVLHWYRLALVERLVDTLAVATIAAYGAYAFLAGDGIGIEATVPLVAVAILRYLYLARRHGLGEQPEDVLLGDRPIIAIVALWTILTVSTLAA